MVIARRDNEAGRGGTHRTVVLELMATTSPSGAVYAACFAVGVQLAALQWLTVVGGVEDADGLSLDVLARCTVAQVRLETRGAGAIRQNSVSINQFPQHTCSLSSLHRLHFTLLASRPNVWPAVSSPSGGFCPATGDAAASRSLDKCAAVREPCDAQLLCRVTSNVFRPLEPGIKVSAAIGFSGRCADGQ